MEPWLLDPAELDAITTRAKYRRCRGHWRRVYDDRDALLRHVAALEERFAKIAALLPVRP
jgi:hypothetical protein